MADRIRVNTDQLDRWASDLKSIQSTLENAEAILRAVDTGDSWWRSVYLNRSIQLKDMGYRISLGNGRDSAAMLRSTLGKYCARVGEVSAAVQKASQYFEDIELKVAQLAENSEKKSLKDVFGEEVNGGGGSSGGSGSTRSVEGEKAPWYDMLLEVIGGAGIGGSLIAQTLKWGENLNAEGLMKYAVKSGGEFIKWIDLDKRYTKLANFGKDYANKLRAKEFLGLNKFLKQPSRSANKWTAFKTNFSKGFDVSSKSAWVISGITSAIDNFSDVAKGQMSADRAVIETAVETTGNVFLGATATAITGAALTAAGFAAPVIAVAAVSGIAVAGLDWAWKSTIGQNFKDADGKASGIVETAGMIAGEAWDGLKGWFAEKTGSISVKNAFASWG